MQNTTQIAILLFDGFSNLCLANAVEPLRAANDLSRQPLYRWRFLAPGAGPATSSSGMTVTPEQIAPEDRGDYLFVMPSYGHRDLATPTVSRILRAAAGRYGALVGLDTGAWLLAAAGLLDGHRATSHWDVLSEMAETFPQVAVCEDRVVHDGARISCGGASTTLDLMMELIERHHGASLALEVAALFMYGERPPGPDPRPALPDHRTIRAAAALMRRHVEHPRPIADIASDLGLSQRALERVFRTHATQTPRALYRSVRLAEARRRLEQTTQSVAEIALRAGYRDATAMARAFRAEFGLSPGAARRRVRKG